MVPQRRLPQRESSRQLDVNPDRRNHGQLFLSWAAILQQALRSLPLSGLQYDASGNVTQQSLQSALKNIISTSGMYSTDTGLVIASTFPITSAQYQSIDDFVKS